MAPRNIPKRLFCIPTDPEKFMPVPFPIGVVKIPIPISNGTVELLLDNKFFIILHPESNVAVLGDTLKIWSDSYTLILKLFARFRVVVISKSKDERGFTLAEWKILEEKLPTRREFLSDSFQAKIRELQGLTLKFFVLITGQQPRRGLKTLPMPPGLSEKTFEIWVDKLADSLNVFVNRDEVRKLIIAVLEEADAKKRLEKTIELYNHCVSNHEELKKEFWNRFNELLPNSSPSDAGKPNEITRSELVRRLLTGQTAPRGRKDEENEKKRRKAPIEEDRVKLVRKIFLGREK